MTDRFSQEADSIPKDSMTAKKAFLAQSIKTEKTKIASRMGDRVCQIAHKQP